jgi:sec-independent protein translocase protein TatB
MLNVGWSELLVIGIVLLVVVGPKDLPQTLRSFGRMMRGLRKMSSEFRTQFEEALREHEIDGIHEALGDVKNFDPTQAIRDAVSPLRQAGQATGPDTDNSATLNEGSEDKKSDVAVSTAKKRAVPQEPVTGAKTIDPSITLSVEPRAAVITGGAPAGGGTIRARLRESNTSESGKAPKASELPVKTERAGASSAADKPPTQVGRRKRPRNNMVKRNDPE